MDITRLDKEEDYNSLKKCNFHVASLVEVVQALLLNIKYWIRLKGWFSEKKQRWWYVMYVSTYSQWPSITNKFSCLQYFIKIWINTKQKVETHHMLCKITAPNIIEESQQNWPNPKRSKEPAKQKNKKRSTTNNEVLYLFTLSIIVLRRQTCHCCLWDADLPGLSVITT